MRGLFIFVVLLAGVGGGYLYLRAHPTAFPGLQNVIARVPIQGQVEGISTDLSNVVTSDRLQQVAALAQKAGGVLGVQTMQTGTQVVAQLTQTPVSSSQSIDVSQAVAQIQSQVEKIPATLVKQAQIEYCKQVLEQATQSASPAP